MTGFARVRRSLPAGEAVLTLKSVNHRGLDLHFHTPPELDPFEAGIRALIKSRVARGHIQIHVSVIRAGGEGQLAWNRPLLDAYIGAFREATRLYHLAGEPDLNTAFRIPGMFGSDAPAEPDPELERALGEMTEEALTLLNAFREREGAAIVAEMKGRCATIASLAASIEKLRENAIPAFQKRLKDRMSELLRGIAVDPQRIAQEAALLGERSDISEELIRLKTHAAQLDTLLSSAGDIGKRLDFLLQEMNRETNTILSKTGGLGDLGLSITDLALAAKAEIDKIREQSLNLE